MDTQGCGVSKAVGSASVKGFIIECIDLYYQLIVSEDSCVLNSNEVALKRDERKLIQKNRKRLYVSHTPITTTDTVHSSHLIASHRSCTRRARHYYRSSDLGPPTVA